MAGTVLDYQDTALAAVGLDRRCFRCASVRLRADKAFVLEALGLTSRSVVDLKRFVSSSLREDKDVCSFREEAVGDTFECGRACSRFGRALLQRLANGGSMSRAFLHRFECSSRTWMR